MPAEFQIRPTLRLKHARIWGRTNFAEIESCFTRTLTDPAFRFDLRILADLRGLSDPVGGLWEFWKLKQMYKTVYGAVHQAVEVVILAETPLAYRVARLFAWLMRDKHPLRVRVARDLDQALQMLSLPKGCLPTDPAQDTASNIVPLTRFKSV